MSLTRFGSWHIESTRLYAVVSFLNSCCCCCQIYIRKLAGLCRCRKASTSKVPGTESSDVIDANRFLKELWSLQMALSEGVLLRRLRVFPIVLDHSDLEFVMSMRSSKALKLQVAAHYFPCKEGTDAHSIKVPNWTREIFFRILFLPVSLLFGFANPGAFF